MSDKGMRRVARIWMAGVAWAAKTIVGMCYKIEGIDNLGTSPVLIASKHQSAWETLTFHRLVPSIAIVLKEELTRVPIIGWYLMIGGNLRLDRKGGAKSLRRLSEDARSALERGSSILIFPEGTRQDPNAPPDYKSGVAALYKVLNVPVVPVALNSGVFWPKSGLTKRPGEITLRFLEPIPPGLARREFMSRLESQIETATANLVDQVTPQGSPDWARISPSREDGRAY